MQNRVSDTLSVEGYYFKGVCHKATITLTLYNKATAFIFLQKKLVSFLGIMSSLCTVTWQKKGVGTYSSYC